MTSTMVIRAFEVATFTEGSFEDIEKCETLEAARAFAKGVHHGASAYGGGNCAAYVLPDDLEEIRENESAEEINRMLAQSKTNVRMLSPGEMLRAFLDHINMQVEYWNRLPSLSLHQRLEGLVGSMLELIDGKVEGMPPFRLSPDIPNASTPPQIGHDGGWWTALTINKDVQLHKLYAEFFT